MALLWGHVIDASATDELNVHPVCARAARLESTGQLESVFLTGQTEHVSETVDGIPREIDRTTIQVDINNDGNVELVVVDRVDNYGTSFRLVDSSGSTLTFRRAGDDASTPANDRYYVHKVGVLGDHGTNFLVIWKQGVFVQSYTMDEVFRIDGSNVAHSTCTFRVLAAREHRTRKGAARVCRAVVTGRVKYAAFNVPVAAQIKDEWSGSPVALESKAARVDIDNDGTRDLIGITTGESAMTDTCSWRRLERLNPDGTGPAEPLTPTSLAQMTEECADVQTLPFRFDGKTYIDRSPMSGSAWEIHNVDALEGSDIRTVCVIDVLKKYEVVDPYDLFMTEHGDGIKYIFGAALEKGPGLRFVELVYRRNRDFQMSLHDQAQVADLMSEAADQKRVDAAKWLMEHGFDARTSGTRFLSKALADTDFPQLPMMLITRGADPKGLEQDVIEFAAERPAEGLDVILAMCRRLKQIPRHFIDYGVETDALVLEKLADLGLPVEYDRETQTRRPISFMERFGEKRDGSKVTGESLLQLQRLERNSPPANGGMRGKFPERSHQ